MTRILCLLLLSLAALPPAPAAPPARSPAVQHRLDERLIAAAESGETEDVKALLARGAHINYADSDDNTALDLAVYWNNAEMVRLLLAHGASPKDRLLLFDANLDVTKLLIAYGVDVNEKTDDGETALIEAANIVPLEDGTPFSDTDKIKVLLRHGADVNARTTKGETALMRAAKGGFAQTVRLLLAHGANPNLKDKTGKTALDMARKRHHRAVVNLLRAARKAKAADGDGPEKLRAICRKQEKPAV